MQAKSANGFHGHDTFEEAKRNVPKRCESSTMGDRMKAQRAETISIREAAERLGLSVWATRRAAASGDIPAIRVNARWRVLKAPFEQLLRVRTGGSP
jgi:excisionase family DNA binding protein